MIKIISNMGELKKFLLGKGIKPTYQRLEILYYMLKKMNSHPTVDTIYEELYLKIPPLSKTTVYNILKSFVEKKIISAITITGSEVRYDANITPHHHFLCTKCGRIIDLDLKCPFEMQDKNRVLGHRVEEVHGYLKGICKECLKRRKNEIFKRNKN